MKEIEFWYSIGSTYTYLTVERIFSVEKENNVKFIWKPFRCHYNNNYCLFF